MANLVSQKEGVDLDDFQPGQAKKKIAIKKTNPNTGLHKSQSSVAVNTAVATSDPSSLSADVDLSTNSKVVLAKSNSSKAATNQRKVTFATVMENVMTKTTSESITDVQQPQPTNVSSVQSTQLPPCVDSTIDCSITSNAHLNCPNQQSTVNEEKRDGSMDVSFPANSIPDESHSVPRPTPILDVCLQDQNLTADVVESETAHVGGVKNFVDQPVLTEASSVPGTEDSNPLFQEGHVSVLSDDLRRKENKSRGR